MQPTSPVRVAVVNDFELVVAGTAAVLHSFAERVRVVEIDAGRPVVSDVDVVLYDSFGQVQGGEIDVDALVDGRRSPGDPRAKIVVFSWNTDPDLIDTSMRAGASGYVSKGVSALQLVEAIERVHAQERVTPGSFPMPEGDTFGRWPGDDVGLSPREAEVLTLICQGLSNVEVTQRAFLGMNTVKTYIRALYAKIGVTSRTQAVLWGIDHGFRPDRVRVT